jgi:hypothetical protein
MLPVSGAAPLQLPQSRSRRPASSFPPDGGERMCACRRSRQMAQGHRMEDCRVGDTPSHWPRDPASVGRCLSAPPDPDLRQEKPGRRDLRISIVQANAAPTDRGATMRQRQFAKEFSFCWPRPMQPEFSLPFSRQTVSPGRSSLSVCEDVAYEALGYFLLDLVHGALVRTLIRSPSQDGRAMPKPAAGEVIVGNLDNVFRPHRRPH